MSGSFFENGSPSNYTIGGARLWFNEDVDLTETPPLRKGFIDLGNVVEHSFESAKEVLDHFTTRSGARRKDLSVNRQITEALVVTLDELSVENMKKFFRGDSVTEEEDDVAETPTIDVTDEVVQLNGVDEVVMLGQGYSAEDVVVKDITGVTTYVPSTDPGTGAKDYELVTDSISGYIGIKRLEAGAIDAGDFVRISYSAYKRKNKLFYPQTKALRTGQALFFGVSDIGNEFIRSFNRVSIEPEGNFSLNNEDWSSFQLRMEILDDSEANPTAPFGLFRHFGVGTGL